MSKKESSTFIEICIYEVKPDRVDEFEELIKKVISHHSNFPGVVNVRYMKRTHRPCSFGEAKKGNPAIRLTKKPKTYTYVLYWELDNEITHGKATKSGLEKYFKEFNRCLVTVPKMILGERIK
jgi:heme-degrading monooxygenase HmoA